MPIQKNLNGLLLGTCFGVLAAIFLGILLTSGRPDASNVEDLPSWDDMSFIFAIPGVLGGAAIGFIALWIRVGKSTAKISWKMIACAILIALFAGAAGGFLFGLLASWPTDFKYKQTIGFDLLADVMSAGLAMALLGVVFAILALPVSAPLAVLLIRKMGK